MSFRKEVSERLLAEQSGAGIITLSRQLEKEATIRLETATRAYEEARRLNLPYDLSGYGIGVFGSARLSSTSRIGKNTSRFIQRIIEQNPDIPLRIVTGGGPGIMEAANRGAHNDLEKNRHNGLHTPVLNYGITISLPHQEGKNRFVSVEDRHPEFSTRMQRMLDLINGALIITGGYGTIYETFMTLQNRQVNLLEHDFLIVAHVFWKPVIDTIGNHLYHQFRARGKKPMIDENDLNLIKFVRKPQDAVDIFSEHIQKWWNEFGRFIVWID